MAKLIQLTRVFKNKGKTGLVKQPISVRADAIDSVRGSNRLGFPDHRSTITLRSGMTVELHETKAVVDAAIARAA